VRAVASSLSVAIVLGGLFLAYDLALTNGARLPGGDLRLLAGFGYVIAVLAAGSLLTYRFVPQPSGASGVVTRSAWSAALGLFAAVPIAYLVLVAFLQIVRPLLV
jgi:hypothetical protein